MKSNLISQYQFFVTQILLRIKGEGATPIPGVRLQGDDLSRLMGDDGSLLNSDGG